MYLSDIKVCVSYIRKRIPRIWKYDACCLLTYCFKVGASYGPQTSWLIGERRLN